MSNQSLPIYSKVCDYKIMHKRKPGRPQKIDLIEKPPGCGEVKRLCVYCYVEGKRVVLDQEQQFDYDFCKHCQRHKSTLEAKKK